MALITCPDCQKQISDQAPTCPHCGRPMQAVEKAEKVQTIEATGKAWKGIQLIGGLMVCVGVIACVYSAYNPGPREASLLPGVLFIGGFFVFIFGRFGAWWKHE